MMMIRAHIQWHWDRFKRISASERTLTALILDLDFKHPLPINHFQVSEEAQGPKWSLRLLILSSTRSEHLWTVRKIWHFYEVSDSSDTFLKCEINTLWSVSHFSEVSEASDTFLMCREVSEESDTSRSSEQSWTVFWHFLWFNFFLQHYGVFLQVPYVFYIFRPRACTYRSEPYSCSLAYDTALIAP